MADHTYDLVREHVRSHAFRYYPEMVDPSVRLKRADVRPRATLYYFDIEDTANNKGVIVKVATSAESYPVDDRRPKVAEVPDPELRHQREYESLTALERSISAEKPAGIEPVHVLDQVPDCLAIVMEEVPGRDFGAVLGTPSPAENPSRVGDLVATAGRWLRHFHGLDIDGELSILHSSVDDYMASVREQTDFLGRQLGRASQFDTLAHSLEDHVAAVQSLRLPIAVRHGDFKPENLIVRPDGALVGIDSVPGFRSVIYEDIAKFTVRLELFASPMMRQHVMARSLRSHVSEYRFRFLSGYFGADAPHHPEVEMYELLRLLHDWSKRLVQQELPRSGRSKLRRRIASAMANRHFEPRASELVSAIASIAEKSP